jgi:hypothetical protein
VGRAMLIMRCEPCIVLNPDDPLRYGMTFFRSHDVDSTTWVAVESRRLQTATDAFPSLVASAGALRQATLDTPPPLAGDDSQGQMRRRTVFVEDGLLGGTDFCISAHFVVLKA